MWIYVVAVTIGFAGLFYFYVTRKYGFFKASGIVDDPPCFPFGSSITWGLIMGKMHMIEACTQLAEKYPDEKVLGYYSMGTPVVVVKDLELAKNILIKDFDHFQNRQCFALAQKGKLNEVIKRMLLNLQGEEWKVVRAKMSPVFTSGKLKGMIGMINKVGDNLVQHLDMFADSGEEFESKKAMSLFSLDVIATCGFGVQSNSFVNPEGPMNKMAQNIMNPGILKVIELFIMFMTPKIAELLDLSFFNKKSMSYFYDVIVSTVRNRKQKNLRRNDFVDHILDALKDKKLEQDDLEDQFEKDAKLTSNKELNLTESELERDMVANALLFFFAGLDTASTVLAIIMITLTQHPDVQERVYEEIREAVEESQSQGKETVDYKTAQELPLLDALIYESMRSYPIGFVERVCSKDYHVPNTNLMITKEMIVQIPAAYFHHHADYFPGGKEFNLDNWTPEAKASRSPYAFMGFGQGPRNCIGMRFAILEMKYALIQIISNFKILPAPKTPKEMHLEPRSVSGLPVGGTWVKIQRRD